MHIRANNKQISSIILTFLPWLRPWLLESKSQSNGNYETILVVKFLAFWKLRPRSLGTNALLVPQPKSWGPVSPGPYVARLWLVRLHAHTAGQNDSQSNSGDPNDLDLWGHSFTYCRPKPFRIWIFVQLCSSWHDFNWQRVAWSFCDIWASLQEVISYHIRERLCFIRMDKKRIWSASVIVCIVQKTTLNITQLRTIRLI